ncbi:type I restriction-modification enzyme R subunit C-terminal domain-containing protein [Methylovulum miyakonense]|uniref:type I restriction-modification enzyme R subunit C-terminal domain-containing protein n=1 Tax=Methylovulum miyakonense TaxID=645578 RepID=UPI003BB67792
MEKDVKRDSVMTEADTSREFVTPKLVLAGWSSSPHSIGEQRIFTNGRIIVSGGKVRRGKQKRADYLLYYRRDLPIAVVEAKNIAFPAETGVQQAREYAEILGLKFAYATNGHRIIEIDYTTGTEQYIDHYPSPSDLWLRLTESTSISEVASNHLLEPFNLVSGKIPRYYQVIAINRVMEAILLGHKRILATLATGTGKTCVAFQLCWKLWNSRWTNSPGANLDAQRAPEGGAAGTARISRTGEYRRPKILFLADRNILVDDPMAKMFAPFGDARYKISSNDVSQGREMYFGIYQALTNPYSDVFRQYRPDFFDLIIIDECHRGSSRDDSSWRLVLDYFKTEFLKGTDRFAKTLVFCVDQEHASEMRQELLNLNSDLVKQYPDYVCRVTADEAAIGLTHLAHFQDVDKPTPTILTTSQLLTTGVDAEMVKNVVLARVVGSRSEFRQIIGRGTRLKVDYGKEYFNIIDFTGTATRHFADPDFDGDPALIEVVTIDKEGETVDVVIELDGNEVHEPSGEYQPEQDTQPNGEGEITSDSPDEPRKFYIDGGTVEVIGHLVYDLDTDGKKLQVVRYTEYSGRAVRSLYPDSKGFQTDWANPDSRSDLLRELTERGISFEELAASSELPDADPFDLLCHLAWNAPLLTRRQRAEQARKSAQNLFSQHTETAREILSLMLDKYIERGIVQFNALSELMKVQPFEQYGTPTEIANRHFGGIQGLKSAVSQLQSAIYQ